jgi:hypothetical protein
MTKLQGNLINQSDKTQNMCKSKRGCSKNGLLTAIFGSLS